MSTKEKMSAEDKVILIFVGSLALLGIGCALGMIYIGLHFVVKWW